MTTHSSPTPLMLRTGSWCCDTTVSLDLPSHWQLSLYDMAHGTAMSSSLIRAEIAEALRIGVPGTSDSAGHRVVIVVDDHSRPTPVGDILRPLCELLLARGVAPEAIKILVAVGTHEFDDRRILVRKIGNLPRGIETVVPDCRSRKQYTRVGSMHGEIPVLIHRAYAEADTRIAISGIYPHDDVSFSGGAKILIGILGLATISKIHRRHTRLRRGGDVENAFRHDLECVAEMVSLDMSINCVLNRDKDIAHLRIGAFREAFRAAVEVARGLYGVRPDTTADIVLANAFPMDTALCVLGKSRWCFRFAKPGAFKVLVTALCDCPMGRVPFASGRRERIEQYLKRATGLSQLKAALRSFKVNRKRRAGRMYNGDDGYLVFVPYVEPSRVERPRWIESQPVSYHWDEVVHEATRVLGVSTPAKVAAYVNAPMLYPLEETSPPARDGSKA